AGGRPNVRVARRLDHRADARVTRQRLQGRPPEIPRSAPAYFDRGNHQLLQGELSSAAVPGGDLPTGEVPGFDDPRPGRFVVDARSAQRHLALPGKRPDAGD